MGGWGRCVWDSADADGEKGKMGGGVGRCILEVGVGVGEVGGRGM